MSFLDADYSAIEARIYCWLCGQEDALAEYRQGLDRYKRMATVVYGIPEGRVNKHPQRFVGKQCILGCGFGMGPPKFRITCKKMGGYDLPAGLEDTAVGSWRATHTKVVRGWADIEKAAKSAITHKGQTFTACRLGFHHKDIGGMPFLLLKLPSGRKLAYPKPKIRPHRKFEGRTEIAFYGHILGAKWGDVSTWGGTLLENCLIGETKVFSQSRGWIQIRNVKVDDRIWDGVEFVRHLGVVTRQNKEVINCHGVWATPDHKFLTVNGWMSAESACTLPIGMLSSLNETCVFPSSGPAHESFGPEVRNHAGDREGTGRREEDNMDVQMRLRRGEREARGGTSEEGLERVWPQMSFLESSYLRIQDYSRNESTSGILGVEEHDRQMQPTHPSSVAQLRGSRDFSLPPMDELREILAGHGVGLPARLGSGPDQQRQKLHPEELPLDHAQAQLAEQEEHSSTGRRTSELLGRGGENRDWSHHALLPFGSRSDMEANHQHPSESRELVYDILNCGPRTRFAVKSKEGILIVHNCTQAVAADIMAHGAHNCEREGYQIATLIHDQALAYHQPGQTAERFVELLTDLPEWAQGLPIEAEGSLVCFYKKD